MVRGGEEKREKGKEEKGREEKGREEKEERREWGDSPYQS